MYDRMLNKNSKPTIEDMSTYCGENADLFKTLNNWLSINYATEKKIVFPYGNHYGWGITHRKKNKLICNIFAEENAFTVMIRLSNKQFESEYDQLLIYTKECIDNKFPCGDGGWIHYRVTSKEQMSDIETLLTVKCLGK